MLLKINKKLILILVCVFGLMLNAFAGESVEDFSNNVATKFEKIGQIQDKAKQKAEIKRNVKENFDLQWIGGFVLGKNKKDLSEQQKQEFIDVFSEYLINNYLNLFLVIKKSNFKILSTENRKNVYFVNTKIKYDDTDANVSFRVVENNDIFLITDIITEGVSFISTQRGEVDSKITQLGFKDFITELKEKNDASK